MNQHDKYESGNESDNEEGGTSESDIEDENSPGLSQMATIHSDEDVIKSSEGQEGSVSDNAMPTRTTVQIGRTPWQATGRT